jgi:chromosome partitioning protein
LGKVICINNNKGGTLKTTTVTNLAGALALKKKKILIIDADNQSNVALSFGLNPDKLNTGLYDVLVEKLDPKKAIIKAHKNIDILPSSTDLVGFDFTVINNPLFPEPFKIMKQALDSIKKDYDYIIVDTPPSLSLIVGNVFCFADEVLIPFTPEHYSMRSLIKVLETINDFKQEHAPRLKVLGVLPVMVDSRTTLHSEVLQETRKFCLENKIRMFDTIIPKSIRFASAVAYENKPAILSKKGKEVGSYYNELWKEIETENGK